MTQERIFDRAFVQKKRNECEKRKKKELKIEKLFEERFIR